MCRIEEGGGAVSAEVERGETEVQKNGMDNDNQRGGNSRPEGRE